MKKETFAVLLLALLLALSVLNEKKLDHISKELIRSMDECRACISGEDWDGASDKAEGALANWDGNGYYTHIVLRHGEVDAITADLYHLLENIGSKDAGPALDAARLAAADIDSMSSIEKIRLGSIF